MIETIKGGVGSCQVGRMQHDRSDSDRLQGVPVLMDQRSQGAYLARTTADVTATQDLGASGGRIHSQDRRIKGSKKSKVPACSSGVDKSENAKAIENRR